MSKKNLISATLSDADKDAVKKALSDAKARMPFLIALSLDERKNSRKMGQKSVEYVKLNLRGAKAFPQYLTVDFDTTEFGKDENLISQVWDIRVEVASFLESIDDTLMAAGIDAMTAADDVYDQLKKAAKKDGAVKGLVSEIGQRYTAQSKPRKNKNNTPTK